MQETWVQAWVGKIPWRRAWQPTPVLLPGQSPWTEMPGGLQSFGLQKVGHNWAANHIAHTLSYINLLTFLNVGIWSPTSRMRGDNLSYKDIVMYQAYDIQKTKPPFYFIFDCTVWWACRTYATRDQTCDRDVHFTKLNVNERPWCKWCTYQTKILPCYSLGKWIHVRPLNLLGHQGTGQLLDGIFFFFFFYE